MNTLPSDLHWYS